MSIATQITRINNNIKAAYSSLENKGAVLPQSQNSTNLANAIDSVSTDPLPSGGTAGQVLTKTADGAAWQNTQHQDISGKVDKETGKGLSSNDYTIAEKNKLSGIETGANKTTVDSALSLSSENPVQNKVVKAALDSIDSIPSGGTAGQVLTKTANGSAWQDPQGGSSSTAVINKNVNFVGMSIWWYDGRTLDSSGFCGGVTAKGYQTLLKEQFTFSSAKNYCYSVLTYRNGKVVRLFGKFENFAYPTKYYKKKCAFIAVSPMISKMNKFIVRDNAAGKYFMKFQDDIKSTTEYYRGSSNHKQISSARLRSFMKNYTNGATPTRITYYQNTKTNRNKYLK